MTKNYFYEMIHICIGNLYTFLHSLTELANMSWLIEKYLNFLSPSLMYYKQIRLRPLVVCFRCPYCGDSKRHKFKRRGYVYEFKNNYNYYCHNCGASKSFISFLREQQPSLYRDYKLDLLKNSAANNDYSLIQPVEPIEIVNDQFDFGQSLTQCESKNPVLKYVNYRKIPKLYWSSLFATCVKDLAKQLPKYKLLAATADDEPVLAIPFFNKSKQCSHICCRAISNDTFMRYLFLTINDEMDKLWGIEFIDWQKPIYVFEGPIDAMSWTNSLALGGSNNTQSIDLIKKSVTNLKKVCFVYDNELLSNRHILKQVKARVAEGFSVLLYDKHFPGKDLNMVVMKNDWLPIDIFNYISKRTFNGLRANLELSKLTKFSNY